MYGTGKPLEEAVLKALRFLGLKAKNTEKGFTADILAETQDGSRTFGFEVTGLNGAIKKESKKLTQLTEFDRIKEHSEKTILIAGTHNTTPIPERQKLEDFSPQVLDYFGRQPILLMTSLDLYHMVGDVLAEKGTREEIIDILYTTQGKLSYQAKSDG